jgi:hypothetical protein
VLCSAVGSLAGLGWGLVRRVLVNAVGWAGTFGVVSFVPLVLTSLVWPWWGLPHLVVIRYTGDGYKISIGRNKKEE